MLLRSIVWTRLDTPGHEACTLSEAGDGWLLEGTAVFVHEGHPARLDYSVACDRSWRTQRGQIEGLVGTHPLHVDIVRSPDGVWTHNGSPVHGLESQVDLDLGFSPSTNLCQIRRLDLSVGDAADCRVAWLDLATATIDVLVQRYERRSEFTYWYEAPQFDYRAELEVDELGFVRRYPGLWEAAAATK